MLLPNPVEGNTWPGCQNKGSAWKTVCRDAARNHCSVLRVRPARIDAGSNREPSEGTPKCECAAGKERETWRALPAAISQLLHTGKTHSGVISITGQRQDAKPYEQRKLRSPRPGFPGWFHGPLILLI